MALTKVSRGLLSTSIVDNGNATAITIDANENVGIGTSSPNNTLSILGSVNQLDIETSTTGVTIESIDRSDVAAQSDLSFYARNGEHKFFGSAYTERMRIDSSGHLILKKNLVLESTSEGIDFSGVGASAQTLDDYEEGSFTPALNGFTGSYIHQIGQYRKVGGLVTAAIHIHVSSTGGSGDIIVTGLPFTQTSSNRYGGATAIHCNSWATTTKPDNALVNPGTTNAAFYKMQGQTGLVTPQLSDMGTGNLLCVFVYMTDQ